MMCFVDAVLWGQAESGAYVQNGKGLVQRGSINDVCVHPSSKFAVTCGQDKARLPSHSIPFVLILI